MFFSERDLRRRSLLPALDLTSTSTRASPFAEWRQTRFGYSRKSAGISCWLIALIVTPEGFPLTYEVLAGNTADATTLPQFLERIERLYGKARRIWVMDRGIPTEAHLALMRERGAKSLAGTRRGQNRSTEFLMRLAVGSCLRSSSRHSELLSLKGQRPVDRRAMRAQRLRRYLARLQALQRQRPRYDTLLTKLGAAQALAGRAASLVRLRLPPAPDKQTRQHARISLRLDHASFAGAQAEVATLPSNHLHRSAQLLLRCHCSGRGSIEEPKIDCHPPVFHQREDRLEAHLLVCFLACCVHVTLSHQLKQRAPGLTPRQALDKLAAIQMLDVHFPTTDGRELIFTRYTEPEADQQLILAQLTWTLPPQAPPRITAKNTLAMQK